MDLADLFWFAAYGFALCGSVSFGYLSLRYSVPDVRGLPAQLRLGLAGLAGLVMFAVAAAASIFLGKVAVLALMPLLAACAIAILEARYRLLAGATMKVAVPVAVMAAPAAPAQPPAALERPAWMEEEKKPSLFGRLFRKREKAIEAQVPKAPAIPPYEEKVPEMPELPPEEPVAKPEASVIEKPPEAAPAEKPGGEKLPETERPAEKPSFFGKMFKRAPAPKEEKPEEKPAAGAPAAPAPEAAKAPVAVAPAAEAPAGPVPAQRRRRRYDERVEERAGAREMFEQPGPAPEAMSERRRRYLARRGELVDQVREDLSRPRELPPAAAPEEVSLEEISKGVESRGVDTSSLEQVGSLQELGDLAELESLSKIGGDVDVSSLGGLAEIQEIPKPKGAGCPRCSALHSTVVYCPYCGKGFCSNCSSKVQAKQDLVFYVCPACSKEVIVKNG